MAGYWRGLIPAVGMLFLLLVLWGPNGQGAQTVSKFQLPRIPKSAFTPAEQKGKSLYDYYCALCHGNTGKGDGINSYNLSAHPRNFTDRTRMADISDGQIQKVILNGGTALGLSPLMQAWGGVLTKRDASDLTAFIRTFAPKKSGKK